MVLKMHQILSEVFLDVNNLIRYRLHEGKGFILVDDGKSTSKTKTEIESQKQNEIDLLKSKMKFYLYCS